MTFPLMRRGSAAAGGSLVNKRERERDRAKMRERERESHLRIVGRKKAMSNSSCVPNPEPKMQSTHVDTGASSSSHVAMYNPGSRPTEPSGLLRLFKADEGVAVLEAKFLLSCRPLLKAVASNFQGTLSASRAEAISSNSPKRKGPWALTCAKLRGTLDHPTRTCSQYDIVCFVVGSPKISIHSCTPRNEQPNMGHAIGRSLADQLHQRQVEGKLPTGFLRCTTTYVYLQHDSASIGKAGCWESQLSSFVLWTQPCLVVAFTRAHPQMNASHSNLKYTVTTPNGQWPSYYVARSVQTSCRHACGERVAFCAG